jgi:hypothetical protein
MKVEVVAFHIDGEVSDKHINDTLRGKDIVTIWFDQSYHTLWVIFRKEDDK